MCCYKYTHITTMPSYQPALDTMTSEMKEKKYDGQLKFLS